MRQAKVSCNNQPYSQHHAMYNVRVKRCHMSTAYNDKGKTYVADKLCVLDKLLLAKTCITQSQITNSNCKLQGIIVSKLTIIDNSQEEYKNIFQNNFMILKRLKSQNYYINFLEFSHKHSGISMHEFIFGPCSDLIAY